MGPKPRKQAAAVAVAAVAATTTTTTTAPAVAVTAPTPSASSSQNPLTVFGSIFDRYTASTPSRIKLIDAFLLFLVFTGVVQFAYCVVAGNYPFNAFLAGFSATVGQFVLTASLRIQSNPANKSEFSAVSPERAFADFVFGSVVLHFFCINFIN